MSEQPTFRCAVYTRKSSEDGLEQDFNSLEAQREAGEAYVCSQANEGWVLVPDRFDDGGFSGGNMERPALGRLMGMVRDGKIDIIVIYKIDRLTRSLKDVVIASPSAAASIVAVWSASGPRELKISGSGEMYRDWRASGPDGLNPRRRLANC